jgi:hypothetical protein
MSYDPVRGERGQVNGISERLASTASSIPFLANQQT